MISLNKDIFLPVTGMHCASCAMLVEKTLKKAPGVSVSEVNYATEKLHINYNPETTNLDTLKAKVENLGYGLILPEAVGVEDSVTPLEPHASSASSQEAVKSVELEKLRAKVHFSLPLALWFFLAMVWESLDKARLVSWPFFMDMDLFNKLSFLVATVVLFGAGQQFLAGVTRFLRKGNANMDTLVGVGTGSAWLYSSFQLFFPNLSRFWGLPEYTFFDVTIVVIAFILLGKYLEARSKVKTGEAIKALLGLQAKTALVEREGLEVEIPLDQVVKGDVVLVKPGSKIPVDGVVILGESAVDESLVTGESLPASKKEGDQIVGGSLNGRGFLKIRAIKIGKESFLASIIAMVEQAQGSKAPIQGLADRISSVFVPAVLIIAALSMVLWMILGAPTLGMTQAIAYGLSCAMAVLVIACPCALGLATPTAIVVGVGKGAAHGILVKDAQSLELLAGVDTVVFDKTGTLTQGKPRVVKYTGDAALRLAASLESLSEHPLASAVLEKAKELNLTLAQPENFSVSEGKGLNGSVEGQQLVLGSPRFLLDQGFSLPPEAETWAQEGMTVVVLASKIAVLGVIGIQDPVKPEAFAVVARLKKQGKEPWMITGDNLATAQAVAAQAGITQILAEVLPGEKAAQITKLQKTGKKVAMVGDGINDAPALAQADVGIAMATGTDAAIQSAGLTLLGGDLNRLEQGLRLAGRTLRIIKQNLFWAFIYNVVGIPLAAGLLFPWTGWLLNPVFAGVAMAMSSVSVVTNSLRLKVVNLEAGRGK